MNGVELGGGSIRLHSAELQHHILKHILNVSSSILSQAILTYVCLCRFHPLNLSLHICLKVYDLVVHHMEELH